MAKVIINKVGTKLYYNDDNQLHRDDGPAAIHLNGKLEWFLDGDLKYIKGTKGVWHSFVNDQPSDYPNGLKRKYNEAGKLIWPPL